MMKTSSKIACLAMLVALMPLSLSAATVDPKGNKTLENLQSAFDGESNAHARYLAFAQKADQESYGEVARLFRAAARAEEIHAANHAAVMKKMGAIAEAKLEVLDVKSTKENLQAAIKGESYERDTMYPKFLKQGRTDNNREAIRSFNYAKTAEAEHARLYIEALNNLASTREQSRTYYVCTVCGYTTAKMDFNKCPSCFNPKEKYEAVG
jgi:rubrerythrin